MRLLLALLVFPLAVSAQDNPWHFGIYTWSNSLYTSQVLKVGEMMVNQKVANAKDGFANIELPIYNYHHVILKDGGQELGYKRDKALGFTAYDLFGSLEGGLKIGWQDLYSPIGVYAYCTYGYNQFKFRLPGDEDYHTHRMQNLRMGIDVKIFLLREYLEEYDWRPVIGVKETYVKNLSYSGPNGRGTDCVNDGFRSQFSIGAEFGENGEAAIMLRMDMAHYDIFNRQYSFDGGTTHPYSNLMSKEMNFSLVFSVRLFGAD